MHSLTKVQAVCIHSCQDLTYYAEHAPHEVVGTGSPVVPYVDKLISVLRQLWISQLDVTSEGKAQCADNNTEHSLKQDRAREIDIAKANSLGKTDNDDGHSTGNSMEDDREAESHEEEIATGTERDDGHENGVEEGGKAKEVGTEEDGDGDDCADRNSNHGDKSTDKEEGNVEEDDKDEADDNHKAGNCEKGHARCTASQKLCQSLKKEQVPISQFYKEFSLHKAVHKEQQDHEFNKLLQILERDTTKQVNFNHTIHGLASIYLAELAQGHKSLRAFTRFWPDSRAETIRYAIKLGNKIRDLNRLLPGLGMLAVLAKKQLHALPLGKVTCFVAVVSRDTDLLKLVRPEPDFDRAYLEFQQWIEPSTPFAQTSSTRRDQDQRAKPPAPEVARKVGRPRKSQPPPKVKRSGGRPRTQSSTDRLSHGNDKNSKGLQHVPSKRRHQSSTLPRRKRQRVRTIVAESSQRPPAGSTVHDLQYSSMAPEISTNTDPENLPDPGMDSEMATHTDLTFDLNTLDRTPAQKPSAATSAAISGMPASPSIARSLPQDSASSVNKGQSTHPLQQGTDDAYGLQCVKASTQYATSRGKRSHEEFLETQSHTDTNVSTLGDSSVEDSSSSISSVSWAPPNGKESTGIFGDASCSAGVVMAQTDEAPALTVVGTLSKHPVPAFDYPHALGSTSLDRNENLSRTASQPDHHDVRHARNQIHGQHDPRLHAQLAEQHDIEQLADQNTVSQYDFRLDSDFNHYAGSQPDFRLDSDFNQYAGSQPDFRLDSDFNQYAGSQYDFRLDSDFNQYQSNIDIQFDHQFDVDPQFDHQFMLNSQFSESSQSVDAQFSFRNQPDFAFEAQNYNFQA